MSVMDDILTTSVVFVEKREEADIDAIVAYLEAEQSVAAMNAVSGHPEPEALDSFIELLYMADQEYMEMPQYEQVESAPVEQVLDWEEVTRALEESQQILVMVQEMLSATLAEMGIEDHDAIRVYADEHGWLRLVNDHPRQEEIETALNSPENNQLREYYMSATAGMSMAGSLVGTMAVPPEVLQQVHGNQYAAAC